MKKIVRHGTTVPLDNEFIKKTETHQHPAFKVFLNCYKSGNSQEIFLYLKETCKIASLSPLVEEYIHTSLKTQKIKGFFYIEGIGPNIGNLVTYSKFCGNMELQDEIFPALPIGYESAGTEFWMLLESGKILTIHHDSIPQMVSETKLTRNKQICAFFQEQGALLDVRQLFELHYLLQDATNKAAPQQLHGAQVLTIVKNIMNCSYQHLETLENHSAMEFLYNLYRDFSEDQKGFKLLIKSTRQLNALQSDPGTIKKLNFSYLFLNTPPPQLRQAVNLRTLDLTGNPHLLSGELLDALAQLPNFDTLILRENNLDKLPETLDKLKTLKKIDLSANNFSLFPLLFTRCGKLKIVDFSDNPMSPMEIERARMLFPGLKVNHNINPEIYEAVLNPAACTELDMTACGLSALPQRFEGLTSLEKLVLDDNPQMDMTSALKILTHLPALKTLSLKNCKIDTMPTALAQLIRLQELYLDKNNVKIDEFRVLLMPLTQLKVLSACHNKISLNPAPVSPEESELDALEVLDLSGVSFKENWFTSLQMPELKELYLRGCYIDGPELKLINCPKLQVLDLDSVTIKEFHPSISNLQHLRHLVFRTDNKSQQQFPDRFHHLEQLNILKIKGDKLNISQDFQFPANLETLELEKYVRSTYPAGIFRLRNLTSLIFNNTGIKALPAETGNLTRLKHLKILRAKSLETVPEELCKLRELQVLHLHIQFGKGPEKLPQYLDRLQQLQELNLSHCHRLDMQKELEKIKNLPRLHTLNLSGCLKEALPPAIAQLTGLTRLDISFNGKLDPITSLETVAALENLEELNLISFDSLKTLPESFIGLKKLRKIRFNYSRNLDPEAIFAILGRLLSLEELSFTDCRMNKMPKAISGLQNLQVLTLQGNNCRIIPEGLTSLKKLKRLQLYNTELRTVSRKKLIKEMPNCIIIG